MLQVLLCHTFRRNSNDGHVVYYMAEFSEQVTYSDPRALRRDLVDSTAGPLSSL
jgi:hypothetical protein